MLTTRIIAAAFGAATLLGAAISSAPASATPASAGLPLTSTSAGETGLVQQVWHRGFRIIAAIISGPAIGSASAAGPSIAASGTADIG